MDAAQVVASKTPAVGYWFRNPVFWQIATHAPQIAAAVLLAIQSFSYPEEWYIFALVLLSLILSIAHHLRLENKTLEISEWVAVTLVGIVLFIIYYQYLKWYEWTLLGIGLLFLVVSWYYWYSKQFGKYNALHCVWHVIGGIVLLLVVAENPNP
jgi:hypothetical protein